MKWILHLVGPLSRRLKLRVIAGGWNKQTYTAHKRYTNLQLQQQQQLPTANVKYKISYKCKMYYICLWEGEKNFSFQGCNNFQLMWYKENNFVVVVLLYYIIIILFLYYIYFLLPRQCHRHAAGRVKKCQSSALCNLLITYRNIAVDTVCASTSPHCSFSSTFSVNLSSSQTNSFVFSVVSSLNCLSAT